MKPTRLFKFAVMLAAVVAAGSGLAAPVLLAHHAVYALTLQSSPNGSVVAADGTMDYQISDACDAWATSQRLVLRITHASGTVEHMVSDYVTWEQKDGKLLRFRTRQTSDGKITAAIAGEATREPNGAGSVHYSQPAGKIVALPPGTLFPLAQTLAMFDAVAHGRKFLAVPLFDGTDDNGAEDSFSVMGAFGLNAKEPYAKEPYVKEPYAKELGALLQKVPSGRVTINFFDRDQQDSLPSYDVAMRYWQNGVSDDVAMDFGNFVVKARLTKLTPRARCS